MQREAKLSIAISHENPKTTAITRDKSRRRMNVFFHARQDTKISVCGTRITFIFYVNISGGARGIGSDACVCRDASSLEKP